MTLECVQCLSPSPERKTVFYQLDTFRWIRQGGHVQLQIWMVSLSTVELFEEQRAEDVQVIGGKYRQ